MGLAASQARFLAITARKADCEFRSMQIAQNKLSVTRELQAATEKWQNSLNAEMLVWDYDGTGSDLQAVTYGMLMNPSVYNNFTPYLLTDRGGRVVVSPAVAAAAKIAGIDPDKGGSRTEDAFYEFINALSANNVVSQQTTDAMYTAMINQDKWIGFDGNVYYNHIFKTIPMSGPQAGQVVRTDQCPPVPVYIDEGGNYLGPVFQKNGTSYTPQKWSDGVQNHMPEGATIAYAINTTNGSQNSINIVTELDKTKGENPTESLETVYAKKGIRIVKSNYDPNNGYGSEPMSKNALTGLNISQLAHALKENAINIAGQTIDLEDITVAKFADKLDDTTKQPNTKDKDPSTTFYLKKGGATYQKASFDAASLSDILTGNVVLYARHADNDHEYHADYTEFLENFLKMSIAQIGIALGAYKEGCDDPSNANYYKDEDYANSFRLAYEFTKSAFLGAPYQITEKKVGDADTQKYAVSEAEKINSVVFYKNSGGDYNSASAVSLSNMLDYFLTYVTILEDGFDSGYIATQQVADSNFVTNDPEYRFVVNDAETETNEAILKTDFYQQLFNNLCINGYKTDVRVQNDSDYLEQMLKNGAFFISSLSRDGHFYQSRYNDAANTLIKVVPDEDAIAVAESEYNYTKIKLTAKEDKLDLDMKNIDMEISSLTTEYDSVKNLIAKSVEKTFKQFEG